jgi:hypothetical protein
MKPRARQFNPDRPLSPRHQGLITAVDEDAGAFTVPVAASIPPCARGRVRTPRCQAQRGRSRCRAMIGRRIALRPLSASDSVRLAQQTRRSVKSVQKAARAKARQRVGEMVVRPVPDGAPETLARSGRLLRATMSLPGRVSTISGTCRVPARSGGRRESRRAAPDRVAGSG